VGLNFTMPVVFIILSVGFCLGFYVRDMLQVRLDAGLVDPDNSKKPTPHDKKYNDALRSQQLKRDKDKKKPNLYLVE
jgi:hypothetical protein